MQEKVMAVEDLMPLRQDEQVMKFIYENNLSWNNLSSYADELAGVLKNNYTLQEFIKYFVDYQHKDMLASEIFPDGKRVDIFLHPRFIENSLHSHDYFEIKYVLKGKARILADSCSLVLEEGDFLFVAPWVQHCTSIYDNNILLINIVVRQNVLTSVFSKLFYQENILSNFILNALAKKEGTSFLQCHTKKNKNIQLLVMECYTHIMQPIKTVYSGLLCESAVERLLLELLAFHANDFENDLSLPKIPKKLLPILQYVTENCATVNFCELAYLFGYSEAYLSRMIKKYTNKTYLEILKDARLNLAMHMLQNTSLTVQEVMNCVGYNGQAYFYRIFQEKFGMTPAMFRKQK